jgi:hypothetical protein
MPEGIDLLARTNTLLRLTNGGPTLCPNCNRNLTTVDHTAHVIHPYFIIPVCYESDFCGSCSYKKSFISLNYGVIAVDDKYFVSMDVVAEYLELYSGNGSSQNAYYKFKTKQWLKAAERFREVAGMVPCDEAWIMANETDLEKAVRSTFSNNKISKSSLFNFICDFRLPLRFMSSSIYRYSSQIVFYPPISSRNLKRLRLLTRF